MSRIQNIYQISRNVIDIDDENKRLPKFSHNGKTYTGKIAKKLQNYNEFNGRFGKVKVKKELAIINAPEQIFQWTIDSLLCIYRGRNAVTLYQHSNSI